ncbi:MAG: HipA domain-containing protein, partial [Coriobacteriales bacterium]
KELYTEEESLPYFTGLLPEGAALSSLAMRLGRAESDYFGLLESCGLDCVGDIIICPENYIGVRRYRRTSLEKLGREFSTAPRKASSNSLASSKLSLAGTQDKIGLYIGGTNLADDSCWYVPEGGAPSNAILKVASPELASDLMIAEQLGMACARACGVSAADTELVAIGRGALVVRRFDRLEASGEVIDGLAAPLRRHQEDFAQALAHKPGSKYAELPGGTAHSIASFLRTNSTSPARDIRELLKIALFNYAIGNADNHLKNLSIIYGPSWKGIRLASAYDLVPTTYYARFSREMGMAIGKTRNIDEVGVEDIRDLARQLGISERLLKKEASALAESLLPALFAEAKRLAERGFDEALYVADGLEEELAKRLPVLKEAAI